MTQENDRLDALEEFAAITGHGLNIPWLEQQIVRVLERAAGDPSRQAALFRTALLLGEGRARLVAQLHASPPQTSSPATAPIDQVEILRRNSIIMERFDREVSISKSYTTVITGAGYAGLLAIWEGLRDHIGKNPLLYSAALIVISLVVFVAWEMGKSRLTQIGSAAFERVVAEKFFTPEFEVASGVVHAQHISRIRITNRFQPLIFWISTISGFSAAAILIVAAIQTATGLKVIFG